MAIIERENEVDWEALERDLHDGGNGFDGNDDNGGHGGGGGDDEPDDIGRDPVVTLLGGFSGICAGVLVGNQVMNGSNYLFHTPKQFDLYESKSAAWNVQHVAMHEKTQAAEFVIPMFLCAALGIAGYRKLQEVTRRYMGF